MDRRRAAGALLALAVCVASSAAAPTSNNDTALDIFDGASEGCYYNFQSYGEGDRIMTNEPCLNCTCHNRMLMCYLRVCPFTKPIGQDCTVEKRADQCCPIVTCPDVPVDLLTSTSTSSPAEYGGTGLGRVDKYGCEINGKYFPEGAKVPPSPNKPCEHCYCIRNMTTCVMQECTLHVEGCTPIYNKDVCCPVRYSCDHPEDEIPMLDDMTTTVRPTPGFLLTTTTLAPVTQTSQECVHNEEIFPDGALIKTEKACEHCYCMKGDIVCVVQECGTPMENEGKNCTSVQPREGQCCPDTYICEGDDLSTELVHELTTVSYQKEETTSPPRRVAVEGSGYRNEDELPYTDIPLFGTESEGSGEEPVIETVTKSEISEKEPPELIDEGFMMTDTPHKFSPTPSEQSTIKEEEKATTEPDKGLNTVPDVLPEEEQTESTLTVKPSKHEQEDSEHPEMTSESVASYANEEAKDKKPTETPSIQTPEQTYDITTNTLEESATNKAHTTSSEELKTTAPSIEATEVPKTTTLVPEKASDIPQLTSSEEVSEISKMTTLSSEQATEIPKITTLSPDQITEMPKLTTVSSEHTTDLPKLTTVLSEQATELPEVVPISSEHPSDLPELTTVSAELVTEVSKVTPQADVTTTSKTEKETTSSTILETTTINVVDNEIDEDSTAYPSPGRIPGEGDCLLDGITYHNESTVLSNNKCHALCKCISSIIKCEPIMCSPPPEYVENCQSMYDSPDACCPTYVCDHPKETVHPESHNQMSGTESPLPPPEECSGTECKNLIKELCTSEYCNVTQTAYKPDITECGSDGCDPNKTPATQSTKDVIVPCVGESCAILPSDKLPESPTKCESEACKEPTSLDQDKEKCDGTDGCKLPEKDISTEECTGNDCRRVGTSDSEVKAPAECVDSECTAQKTGTELDKKPEPVTESDTVNELTTEKQESVSTPDVTASEKPQILDTTTLKHVEDTYKQTTALETSSEQSVLEKETPVITDTGINEEAKSTQEPHLELTATTEASVKNDTSTVSSEDYATVATESFTTKASDTTTTPTDLKEKTESAEEVKPESTKAPGELNTDFTDNEISKEPQPTEQIVTESTLADTTPKFIEKLTTEAITESSKVSETVPVQTGTKCEGSACEAFATSPAPIIPDKKCDINEGCILPDSTDVVHEPSTEQPAKCDGVACEANIPVQPVVPQEDKCDSSDDCKSTDETTKPSCSGNNCDSSNTISPDTLSSDKVEMKPELDITTTSKDDSAFEIQTTAPFTNSPIAEGEPSIYTSVTPKSEDEISPEVTKGFDTKTKVPAKEDVTEGSSVATQMQDTTDSNILRETITPTERGDTESEITKHDMEIIPTTSASHVTEPQSSLSDKPDYHDTEPEKSTEEPSKSVTDQSSLESSSTSSPEAIAEQEKETTLLPVVIPEDQSTKIQQSVTEQVPLQTTHAKPMKPDTDDQQSEIATETAEPSKKESNVPSTETPTATAIPVDVQTKKSEYETHATESATEENTQHTSDKAPEVSDVTQTPSELPMHGGSESPSDVAQTQSPEQPTEGPLPTKEPVTEAELPEKDMNEPVSETIKPPITGETESTTKLSDRAGTEASPEITEKPEFVTKSPDEDKQSESTPKLQESEDKIDELHTEHSVITSAIPESDLAHHDITTQPPKQVTTTEQALGTETYPEETEQKSPKPIATESQILMTEPTKLPDVEIQPTEKPEKPVSAEYESSATTLAAEPAEKEPSVTTAASEPSATTLVLESTEKEPSATTLASEPVEKKPIATTMASEPADNEPSATTVASKPTQKEPSDTKESSATTLSLEPAEKEQSATTMASKPVERESSATTVASEPVEEEPSATTLASEPAEKEPIAVTQASEPAEKEPSVATQASEPAEKESSATTPVSEPAEKEPSATTQALESAEKDSSATTLASEPAEKEQSATTQASEPAEKEPSATTQASEPAEKEPSATTLASEPAEKEPSATTQASEPAEKESSATTLASESAEKEPSATTQASEPSEKEPSATTMASKPVEREPSATTVASEPVEEEPSATTLSSELAEKEPSAATQASEPAEKEPSATTLASESTEKEPSAATQASEPAEKESSATTPASEPAEREPSETTQASEPAEKEPSVTTLASELAEKEPSAATQASEPAEKESSSTTLASESAEKEPSATTQASEPAEKEPSATTMASKPVGREPSATTVASEPLEEESSATTLASESAEKEPSATTQASRPAEQESSATTLASEPAEKEPSATIQVSEEESSATTAASESQDKESESTTVALLSTSADKELIITTPSSELEEKVPNASTETKDKQPESETSATTMASKIDQQESSSTTIALKPADIETSVTTNAPMPEEPSKTNEPSKPDTEQSVTSEPVEKETSVTIPVSELAENEPSATTLESELKDKELIATTPISELAEKETSATPLSESGERETSPTTPELETKDQVAESHPSIIKIPETEQETPAATTPENKLDTSEATAEPEAVSHEQPDTTTPVYEGASSETTGASETTPDQVELELHTHKAELEETSTLLPELSSSQTPERTAVQEESSPELVDGRRTGVPEQTTLKIDMIPEHTEKGPADEPQHPETPAIETTPASTDEIQESDIRYGDDQSSTVSPIPITSVAEEQKVITTSETIPSETPVEPEPVTSTQRPSVIAEEEFIPVTSTKAPTTTEKAEEEPMQTTPAIEKFTKTEEKPEAATESPELPKPVEMPTDEVSPPEDFPPSGGYGQEPDYVEEDQSFGPGTCRYGGKVYVSAQQIPRDDPCDFCFCFRSDIICLQQSCPPPIHGCHEEPISGFCCPRYECPVSMATTLNVTTTTTTTTTTLPPHFFPHAYKGAAQRKGCVIKGQTYKVGDVVRASSGPCLHCTCGGDGQMKCDPKACTPEPMLRQMIAAAVSARRRR